MLSRESALSSVLDSLHRDHLNLVQLTDLARDALNKIEAQELPDFALLEDVMKYATGYPDVHHHPTEDVVFEYLRAKAPHLSARIDATIAEHEKIIAQGQDLLEIVRSIEEDAMVERARVLEVGRRYLDGLDRHMSMEEQELFPAARKFLEPSDWQGVEARVGRQSDPLFGPNTDREFKRLWKRIQLHKPT
jgi:hemerythrin-like domain-containing protein